MSNKAVTIIENSAPAILTPMELLSQATAKGASIDVLEKLMTMQERWEKNQARKAFNSAIAAVKAEIPVIKKNRRVGFESKRTGDRTDYAYEDMAEIARTIDPILTKHGLGYRFRTEQENNLVKVTCILFHRDGHSEENSLAGPNDTSGNKNAIQGIGSSQTFLQRYTLKAALGLAAAEDTNGQGNSDTITDEQCQELSLLLTNTKSDLTRFLKHIKLESLTQIRADKFEFAKKLILDTAARRNAMVTK